MASFITGVAGILLLLAFWFAVQTAWRSSDPDTGPEDDPLAGRLGCMGCDCLDVCEKQDGSIHTDSHLEL